MSLTLTAYSLYDQDELSLSAAPKAREWMDGTPSRFAYRCLPMLLAGQSAWQITTNVEVTAEWGGAADTASLRVEGGRHAVSHFGSGVLTWSLPFLFRTPSGYNLLVRGPANTPRDGVCALEGLVESDRAGATFTVNWAFTRPGSVRFVPGDAVAWLAPQRRGDLEEWTTTLLPIQSSPDVEAEYRGWAASRSDFLKDLNTPGTAANAEGWEKDYFRGAAQKRRSLCPFSGGRT